MNATYIIGATTITNVWIALGGHEPKHGRACAFFRGGKNEQAVSLNDDKGCWFDHRDGVGGGVLDLIQRVLTCDRAGALRWLSSFTGIPLEDRPVTRTEQQALADGRERDRREMQAAEFFRFAAARVAERVLDDLPETAPERYIPTQLLIDLRTARDSALLVIYRNFRAREPRLTAALVYAGEQSWGRCCSRLARFVAAGMEVPSVA